MKDTGFEVGVEENNGHNFQGLDDTSDERPSGQASVGAVTISLGIAAFYKFAVTAPRKKAYADFY